eukprot:GHUV01016656.1.p1 GENE.GHUV01016656.1~~GHUV01016656.1.p1  ORF type:complete len:571 (+),score=121.87 GHUV01016656.1:190-1902(+)
MFQQRIPEKYVHDIGMGCSPLLRISVGSARYAHACTHMPISHLCTRHSTASPPLIPLHCCRSPSAVTGQQHYDSSNTHTEVGHSSNALEVKVPCGVATASDGGPPAEDAAEVVVSDADFGRRENETHKEYLKREFSALKPFVIISLSYILYTTTDGAVRMIVLLHAYNLGFSAWQVAIMFSLYELAGVITNLLAGLMGARWGIKATLLTGLTLQLCGIGMLFGWQESWARNNETAKAIIFVTAAQMLCGIAKDLTKLGGKTVTKLVTPDEKQSRLFKVVSFITGLKNTMKGVGYFIGAAALTFNYYFALALLLLFVAAAMPWAIVGLSNKLGRARKENVKLSTIIRQRYNVNVLSVARFFLFGSSRDMWFEVPLPFFLRDHIYGLGWQRVAVGALLAGFIILYGQVQSWTPQLVLQPLKQSPANKYVQILWNALLTLAPIFMALMLLVSPVFITHQLQAMTGVMIAGILVYCVLFAVNSSVHSFLIVKYADGDKVAMNVGFYYMANALGRLTGTLVSGALYSFAGANAVYGLGWCFVASVAFAAISTGLTVLLKDDMGGLMCGSKLRLVS